MAQIKQWILLVTPLAHLRMLNTETWMVNKDDAALEAYGAKKHLEAVAENKENPIRANHYVNRKRSMQKRIDYRKALQWEAKRNKFEMPRQGAFIKFYLPIPKSFSVKKRKQLAFQVHESKPDVDNILKPFFDALVPKDQIISDFRASKFWYDNSRGFILITLGELSVANGYMITKWENNNFK